MTESTEDDAVAIRCTNYQCHEWVQRRIEYAVSKAALDVEGMGPQAVQQLYGHGLIGHVADLFRLTLEHLRAFGFGEKQTYNLHAALLAARVRAATEQDRILRAFCIPSVGNTASRALMQHFANIPAILQADEAAILACPDLPAIAAKSLLEWRASPQCQIDMDQLRQAGFEFPEATREIRGIALAGEAWCITGTLTVERELMQDILRANGARVVSGVSSKTTHLLAGDKAGSKLDKATKLGIQIVTEEELRTRLGI